MDMSQSGFDCFNSNFNHSADIKYHGLFNQGATCYLNSVLQVLFMTKDFREAVERSICENPDTEFIDRNLKELFEDLKKKTASTCNITKKLGINRVYEQKDAAEYYEKILALTSPDASQIFHGQLTHKTVCSECGTEKNTDGSFWHLPLELVDSYGKIYSVVDGTQEYFRDAHYSRENQMYCDKCDAKSDATIKCALKHYPEVLMLLLKRFEFNYPCTTYVKNNCDVAVPYTLQITESQTYELYAVVDHFNDLRSGHYTANIKSQDNERWYNFNDTSVTLLDYQPFQVDNTERLKNVYLLFYRRKETHAADTCAEHIKGMSISESFPPSTGDNNDQFQDAEKIRERQDNEKEVEVGNDTAETNRDKGADDGELRISYRHQGWNEERSELCDQDAAIEKQEQDKGQTVRDHEEGGKMEKSPNTSVDYQDNEKIDTGKKMKTDVEDIKGNTGADKQTPTSLTNCDFYCDQHQNNRGVGDSERRMPEHDQWGKQGGSKELNNKQQKEEKGAVDGDKEYCMHKPVQSKERVVEDQGKRRLDDVKHNRPEQKICATHTTHKDVGAEEQAKDQENKGDEQIQNREDFSETGFERNGKLTGNQEVTSLEKIRLGDSQPPVKGRHGSKIFVKIIEETYEKDPTGTQKCSQTKILRTETLENFQENSIKSRENIEGSTDINTLLNDSPSPGSQAHRNPRVIVNAQGQNETNTIIHKNVKKRQNVSEAQMQTEIKRRCK